MEDDEVKIQTFKYHHFIALNYEDLKFKKHKPKSQPKLDLRWVHPKVQDTMKLQNWVILGIQNKTRDPKSLQKLGSGSRTMGKRNKAVLLRITLP